jgi:flagellar motor switch protein FliM
MADDILSQAEVESLISAMESAPPLPKSAPVPPPAPLRGPARQREKVIGYDFKRPERVGKEQMRALQSLHEGFGRNFGAALSALLRTIVEVKLTSVDQLTYSEFVFSLENPTCFNLLKAEPLEGHLILDLNPSILYPVIDRLLGGGKENGPITRRPLTEIELRLVGRITGLFLQELKHAWEDVLSLELSVDRVESNPQLVQIVPPNEVVILVSFEVAMGEVRGMINLCIPFNSIERVSPKLAANSWASYNRSAATPQSRARIGQRLDRSLVDVVVTVAETHLTTGDLLGLRVGDIITTDKDIRTPLDVAVQGVNKYLASAGALKGNKAIRVEAVPAEPVALGAGSGPTESTTAPVPRTTAPKTKL